MLQGNWTLERRSQVSLLFTHLRFVTAKYSLSLSLGYHLDSFLHGQSPLTRVSLVQIQKLQEKDPGLHLQLVQSPHMTLRAPRAPSTRAPHVST